MLPVVRQDRPGLEYTSHFGGLCETSALARVGVDLSAGDAGGVLLAPDPARARSRSAASSAFFLIIISQWDKLLSRVVSGTLTFK